MTMHAAPSEIRPLRVGIAGLGTVGAAVAGILKRQENALAARCGRPIRVTAVSARDRNRDRGIDLSGFAWFDDPVALAASPEIDCLVELIGGSDGPAKQAVETALSAGKHVVTANKALLAAHGVALAELAESKGAALAFEASSAGGIRPARMFTWIEGRMSFGIDKVASRLVRIATKSSSLTPSWTCTLPTRCAPTVVSQTYWSRPTAL